MRFFISLAAFSIILTGCDNSSSNGGGGGVITGQCSPGANIIPSNVAEMTLTKAQKKRAKDIIKSFNRAQELAFSNKLVKKSTPAGTTNPTSAINKPKLTALEKALNDDDCQVDVREGVIYVQGDKCPIYSSRESKSGLDEDSEIPTLYDIVSSEFSIQRKRSRGALDVHAFKYKYDRNTTAAKDEEKELSSKSAAANMGGTLTSSKEGEIDVCVTQLIHNEASPAIVKNEETGKEEKIGIKRGKVFSQFRMKLKDFTLYAEMQSIGKEKKERVLYKINGVEVSAAEFADLSIATETRIELPKVAIKQEGNEELSACLSSSKSLERDPKALNPERNAQNGEELEADIYTRIVDELNLARNNPKFYAKLIEDTLQGYDLKGNYRDPFGGRPIKTHEGTDAVEEAVEALRQQEPITNCLKYSKSLSRASEDHAKDQSKTGEFGHDGSDGSTVGSRASRHGTYAAVGENISYGPSYARDIVIGLIVDDNVPDRGHRHNIYNADWEKVGLSCKPHKLRWVCVQNYAKGWRGKVKR